MANLQVRNISDDLHDRLRRHALRASVSPLAVGENLLQGGPLPPIDGEAILGSHEHDLAGEPASILSR